MAEGGVDLHAVCESGIKIVHDEAGCAVVDFPEAHDCGGAPCDAKSAGHAHDAFAFLNEADSGLACAEDCEAGTEGKVVKFFEVEDAVFAGAGLREGQKGLLLPCPTVKGEVDDAILGCMAFEVGFVGKLAFKILALYGSLKAVDLLGGAWDVGEALAALGEAAEGFGVAGLCPCEAQALKGLGLVEEGTLL